MRCERLQGLLPAYIDGDLPRRQNQQVSDHLDKCEQCRRELSVQQRAQRALDAGRHTVSIDLWADFSRRLQSQAPPPPRLWRVFWQPGLAVAAAAVAVAFIAGIAVNPGPTRVPTPSVTGATEMARASALSSLPASHDRSGVAVSRRSRFALARYRRASHHTTLTSLISAGHPRSWRLPASRTRTAALRHPSPVSHRSDESTLRLALMPAPPALTTDGAPNDLRPMPAETGGSVRPASIGAEPADPASVVHSRRRPEADHGRWGDPLRSTMMALAVVEQDTASAQVAGAFRRMAREVVRVGGESTGVTMREPGPATAGTAVPPGSDTSGT